MKTEGSMTDTDAALRATWTEMGVSVARQDELIAEITAKAQHGAPVGPFRIGYRTELTPVGEQMIIPGCERDQAPATKQLSLF